MKKTLLICTVAALIAGCTDFRQMYKPGVTRTELNIDQGACNSEAASRYPPRIVTDWVPIFDAQGRVISHRIEQYDINEARRREGARSCMIARGYEWATIPFCKDEQIAGRSFAPVTKLPALTPNICGMRTDRGRVLIDLSKPL
ncbi:hypothetical protein BXY66_1374 [Shimia isoporae]|uniref:Lipoprotein n=1 Tax=Shimia isoporae TaxID=647720 RepID=A0A4R1NNF0_9RHOB|nr:hypothetical protein [Shimia isoporae]TCL09329.1 hypothetical protein BXY66_1374 [Shimia isoporae]